MLKLTFNFLFRWEQTERIDMKLYPINDKARIISSPWAVEHLRKNWIIHQKCCDTLSLFYNSHAHTLKQMSLLPSYIQYHSIMTNYITYFFQIASIAVIFTLCFNLSTSCPGRMTCWIWIFSVDLDDFLLLHVWLGIKTYVAVSIVE